MNASDPDVLDRDRLAARVHDLHGRRLAAEAGGSDVRIVRAPGRVNLIGEHTDYNDGFVLPVAIGLETWIACVPTDDGIVSLALDESGETASFDLAAVESSAPDAARRGSWVDYVAGTAWALRSNQWPARGAVGVVAATLPREAGLSSSASLELAAAWMLLGPAAEDLACLDLARACQRAENDYVGVRCGLMDQFSVACGEAGAALLLDCRSLEYRAVPLPGDLALVVCHSGAPRRLNDSAYNARRLECERSVRALARERPSINALRDVRVEDLPWAERLLPDTEYRRVRHVVTENERTLAAVVALETADRDALGRLFAASHASLRDDYEVSSPALDRLVEVAAATPGVVAARMTGGGFGGCTVNLVERDAVDRLRARVLGEYANRSGLTPRVFEVEAVDGAGIVE
jgi:galactokinase